MTEAKLCERIVRQQFTIEDQDAAYSKLLNLLAAVVSGTIDTSRVMVNLTDRTWSVAAAGDRPAMPATINGLPQCVTAPAESRLEIAHEAIAALEAENTRLKELISRAAETGQPPSPE